MRPRLPVARRVGTAAVAALLAAGCMSSQPPADPSAARTKPALSAAALREVPPAALDAADAGARQQIEAAYAELLPRAEDASQSDAARGAAYGELGKLLLAASLLKVAEPALVNAETLAPADPQWPYYLGHLHRRIGDLAGAAESFERTLGLAPDDVPAMIWIGRVRLSEGRAEAAEAQFSRVLAADPDDVAARLGLGRAVLARRQYERASRELEQVLALDPGAVAAHYPLGLAYRGLGDMARANAHLAQRADPDEVDLPLDDPRMASLAGLLDSALAHQRRGVEALDNREWAEAARHFRNGLAVAPSGDAILRLSLMHKLGTALWMLGDTDAAIAQFEAGIQLSPGHALNHFSLGVISAQQRELEEARRRFADAVMHDPDFVEARIALGRVLHALGQPEAALPHYAHALRVAPDAAEARYGEAVALAELGRYDEARKLLIDGMRLHPDDGRFADALAALPAS